MEFSPILIAAKPKSRKLTPEEREQRNQEEKEKQQRIQERKNNEKKNDPAYCEDMLGDIKAILNGGGLSVKDRGKYTETKDGSKVYLVGDDPATLPGVIKSSISSRISDLKNDFNNLYDKQANNSDLKDSYKGHQHTLENQQKALRKALKNFDENCKNYPLSDEQKELINKAKEAANQPIPQKPDRELRQNSSSTGENKVVKAIVNSIPGIPQEQKNGIQKSIERSIEGGKDYWDKHGKQQLSDALDNLVKAGIILGTVAVAIVKGVGEALTGGWLQGDNTTEQANPTTVATAANNENTANNILEFANKSADVTTITDTNTQISFVRGASPLGNRQNSSQTNRSRSVGKAESDTINSDSLTTTGTDTAFIGSVDSISDTAFTRSIDTTFAGAVAQNSSTALQGSFDTALRGSVDTALRGGNSQEQQQTQQPAMTLS